MTTATRSDHPDERLPWYMNGTLTGREQRGVKNHLETCERCRQEIVWLQKVSTQIKADAPGGFGFNRLLRDVHKQESASCFKRLWWRPALAAGRRSGPSERARRDPGSTHRRPMSRMVRRGEVTVNRVGPFRCAAILVAVFGGLLAAPPAPAHADVFDGALLVSNKIGGGFYGPARADVVEVVKRAGAGVRIEWNFPAVATPSPDHPWYLRVGTRALTCTADDSTAIIERGGYLGRGLTLAAPGLHGRYDFDLSGSDIPADARYYVRLCMPNDGTGRHHESNQVEILLSAAPARASDPVLRVEGRTDVVEVVKRAGAGVRIEWNFPAVRGPSPNNWQLRVGTLVQTCECEACPVVWSRRLDEAAYPDVTHGFTDLDLSGFPSTEGEPQGASGYSVRVCLFNERGSYLMRTNAVSIHLVPPPIAPDRLPAPRPDFRTAPLLPAAAPYITYALGATPVVMPGSTVGVIGRDFGGWPGRLLLQIGGTTYPLSVSDRRDWYSGSIAGQVPGSISGVPDGPASLIVERGDGRRSNSWSVNFKARQEVRLIPGGEVRVVDCFHADDDNRCNSYPGGPSLSGYHGSPVTDTDESGTDRYSIALENGWRFHSLDLAYGGGGAPVPTWSRGASEADNPSIQVQWINPRGSDVYQHYGFNLYIVGPLGVPHR